MKKSKEKIDKITKIKLLRKAFNKYSKDNQEQMKKDYPLIIRDLPKFKHKDFYSTYKLYIEKLTPDDRTIIFYGTAIHLSKKQFAIIRLLIEYGSLNASDYIDLDFSKHMTSKERVNDNIKAFVSKFKNNKKCVNVKNSSLNDLLFYELPYGTNYILRTNFKVNKTNNF